MGTSFRRVVFGFSVFALVIAIALPLGCSKKENQGTSGGSPGTSGNTGGASGDPHELVNYCISQSGSGVPRGILNGVETDNYPAVVRIRNWVGELSCTGTFVSSTTLITAGHCIEPTYEGGGVQYGNAYALKATSLSKDVDGSDIAVVVFPSGTFQGKYALVLDKAPQVGAPLTIVGYGQTDFINDGAADGRKRIGCNVLVGYATVYSSFKSIYFSPSPAPYLFYRSPVAYSSEQSGENSMTGRGDSGGPVFINGRLAGVVSFGQTRAGLSVNYSFSGEPSPESTPQIYEFDTYILGSKAYNLLQQSRSTISAVISGL